MRRIDPASLLREPGFSRKLTLAFGAVILTVAMTLPVAFYAFSEIRDSAQQAEKAARTLERVSDFRRAIGNMRVKARDYAETGSVADRNDLATQLNVLTDGAREIARGGGSGYQLPKDERERWQRLIVEASEAHGELKTAVADGRGREGIKQFDATMKTNVEREADVLTQNVRERRREAQQQIDDSIITSAALLLIVLAAALGLAGLLAYLIPRSLMRRLEELRHAAHLLARGDLATRVDDEKLGSDEIAELIRDFNAMAYSLQNREEENHTLQQQLQISLMREQERATRDPLTGLRNHRYFQDSLAAELDRCSRSGGKVTIAIIDLDNFKQVNDRFGHSEGDAVLLRVTKGISDNLRPYDLACRLGGEEFGVIFPDTGAEEAQAVLQRIADHILGFGPNGERATFSGGITTYPDHGTVQTELYHRADEAAYTAKMNGKAQTVIYDPRLVKAMDSPERLQQKSREAVLNTATTLVSAVDQKDPYTRHHSELTAIYAATLARALSLDEETVKHVYRAGLLHDVGKIGVSDSILKKPGRLTEAEYEQIKQHPEFSYRILETAEMEPVATWVRHHHEHWNGSGYPFGLAGNDIPLGSRIVLVADAFEAMTSDRVYRRALSTRQAIEELIGNAGTQFDPHIVDVMVDLVVSGVFDQVRAQYGKPPAAESHAAPTQPGAPAAQPGGAAGTQPSAAPAAQATGEWQHQDQPPPPQQSQHWPSQGGGQAA